MRKILLLSLLPLTAIAAPTTYKKAGPDPQGVTTFWVKCENGNVSTIVCLKDVSHCGDEGKQALMTAATLACESIGTFTLYKGK